MFNVKLKWMNRMFPQIKVKVPRFSIYLVLLFLSIQQLALAQEVNSFDQNGKRHGDWQKKYDGTQQLRYEGTFDHGKEIGLFKFYDRKGGHPTAIKKYTPGATAIDVNFFTTDGKKVSEGKMIGRQRDSLWISYHQDGKTIMIEETYDKGLLLGKRKVYFISGNLAQIETYKEGKKEGPAFYYSDEGKVLKEFNYENDQLQGLAKFYNGFGQLAIEGFYKNNRKHGIWKYYEDGKVAEKFKYPQNKIGVN